MAPKTNAERQRDYRARRRAEQGAPLSLWLSKDAHEALTRLSEQRGKTRRETLERLILAADRQAAAGLSDEALEAYRPGGNEEAQP